EFALIGVPETPKSNELEEYVAGRQAMIKPLEFWQQKEKVFPYLAKMARDYLAIPATSAASERCFSQARVLLPYTRNRLSRKTIKEHMLLDSWFKYFD